jgi:hypothetical protein
MARQPYMCLGILVSSRFHGHTHLRHTTVGRTPLDEGPARRRDLYLATQNTHKRQTSMSPLGFEPTIPVSERPKTHALDRTATGIGNLLFILYFVGMLQCKKNLDLLFPIYYQGIMIRISVYLYVRLHLAWWWFKSWAENCSLYVLILLHYWIAMYRLK